MALPIHPGLFFTALIVVFAENIYTNISSLGKFVLRPILSMW